MAKVDLDKRELFETMPVYRAILALAIPNVINQLANVIYNLADTFFIGKLNNSSMVAALTLTMSVMILITAVSNLFCIGSCAVIAAALGAKDEKKARDVATMTPIMAIVFAVVFCVLVQCFREPIALYSGASETSLVYTMQYQFWVLGLYPVPFLVSTSIGAGLRGRGHAKFEMYGLTLGNVLNIILDPIFIFVFGMGVSGAALATFLATVISCTFMIVIARRVHSKEAIYSPLKGFRFNWSYAKSIVTTGFPAFLHSVLASVVNTFNLNVMKNYSDAAVAAYGICRKIEHTFGQVVIGLCQGTIPLISYNYANRNHQRLTEVRKKSLVLIFIWAAISVAIILPLSRQIMQLFIEDETTVTFGIPVVSMYAFLPLTMGYNNNSRTTLQSLGKKKISSAFSILRQLVITVPLIILTDKLWGFYAICAVPLIADVITDIAAHFILKKTLKDIKAEFESGKEISL
ncbi:MAG: MATE family efflux transporter [Clostridia bacterium]|nr:MATE family efflux transporter [Clostridia bacterium]